MQTLHAINFAPFAKRGLLATGAARAELRRMQALTGANAVIFCPGAVQAGPFADAIDFSGAATTGDAELLDLTRYARGLGLRVLWKPTVNCLDGTWRARIDFFDHEVPGETGWHNWFPAYTAFQLHFAALAEQAGIECLILGCEMTQTERREADWRALIAAVRRVYTGTLTYNCDKYGEDHLPFWDALDAICSSGYYPLGDLPRQMDRIESVVRRYGKPFFFAEAGCMRIAGSAQMPNDWTLQGEPDDAEQDRWYRALFAAVQNRPWFGGMALWDWPLDSAHDSAYSFCHAPAVKTIHEYFTREGKNGLL